MGIKYNQKALTVAQREAANIFLSSIFLSLPRFAGLVTLSILLAAGMTMSLTFSTNLISIYLPFLKRKGRNICARR
jgi:hypothetical protein